MANLPVVAKWYGALPDTQPTSLVSYSQLIQVSQKVTTDPTATTQGTVGWFLFNTTNNKLWICLDATANANEWYWINQGASGSATFSLQITNPTSTTVGTLGSAIFNTANLTLWVCTAISGSTYTWSQPSNGVSPLNGATTVIIKNYTGSPINSLYNYGCYSIFLLGTSNGAAQSVITSASTINSLVRQGNVVYGPGVPAGTVINAIGTNSITLSGQVTAGAISVTIAIVSNVNPTCGVYVIPSGAFTDSYSSNTGRGYIADTQYIGTNPTASQNYGNAIRYPQNMPWNRTSILFRISIVKIAFNITVQQRITNPSNFGSWVFDFIISNPVTMFNGRLNPTDEGNPITFLDSSSDGDRFIWSITPTVSAAETQVTGGWQYIVTINNGELLIAENANAVDYVGTNNDYALMCVVHDGTRNNNVVLGTGGLDYNNASWTMSQSIALQTVSSGGGGGISGQAILSGTTIPTASQGNPGDLYILYTVTGNTLRNTQEYIKSAVLGWVLADDITNFVQTTAYNLIRIQNLFSLLKKSPNLNLSTNTVDIADIANACSEIIMDRNTKGVRITFTNVSVALINKITTIFIQNSIANINVTINGTNQYWTLQIGLVTFEAPPNGNVVVYGIIDNSFVNAVSNTSEAILTLITNAVVTTTSITITGTNCYNAFNALEIDYLGACDGCYLGLDSANNITLITPPAVPKKIDVTLVNTTTFPAGGSTSDFIVLVPSKSGVIPDNNAAASPITYSNGVFTNTSNRTLTILVTVQVVFSSLAVDEAPTLYLSYGSSINNANRIVQANIPFLAASSVQLSTLTITKAITLGTSGTTQSFFAAVWNNSALFTLSPGNAYPYSALISYTLDY